MRPPWTREEIDRLLPRLEESIARAEAEDPDLRPLPPMTAEECLDLFRRFMDVAATRRLTLPECGLHGQLLAVFMHAVRAEMLGRTGRYIVISEDEIREQMAGR